MYSFKKYSHNGDFISEIPQKFIKNIPTFHETINSGQGELSLEFSENISENFLKFGELVKIFYDGKIIFSGFVSRKEKIFSEKISIIYSLIGLFSNLNNFRTYMIPSYVPAGTGTRYVNHDYVSNDAKIFFKEMVNVLNSDSNTFKYNELNINNKSDNYTDRIRGTFLDLLNHYKEKYNMNFYIGADGFLKIGVQNKNHILIYGKDVFEINRDEDISQLYNYVSVYRTWTANLATGTYYNASTKREEIRYELREQQELLELKNEESIQKYGMKYKHFGDKKGGSTSTNNFLKRMIEEYSEPFVNIKLKINEKKWFGVLQVMDYITVKNIKEEIENKKIVKISYNHDYIEVELENYNTLGKEILGQ